MALAEAEVRLALDAWPSLTTFGLTDPAAMLRKFGERAEEVFRWERADMTAPDYLAAFIAAQAWIRLNASKRAGMSERLLTCGLAHTMEPEIGFTTIGVVTAVMQAEGYEIKQVVDDEYGFGPMPWAEVNAELCPAAWDRALRRSEIHRIEVNKKCEARMRAEGRR
jgi:hypothetical protein